MSPTPLPHRLAAAALAAPAFLATAPAAAAMPAEAPWQACAAVADAAARLACYDRWAAGQTAAAASTAPAVPGPASAPAATPAATQQASAEPDGCGTGSSPLSRFWELETSGSCGVFGIRLYRPLQMAVVNGHPINEAPTSPNPLNAVPALNYKASEVRLQLSMRTKLAEGLLTPDGPRRDGLWFTYTQQSSWQLFTPQLSRPFRNTDHEPELLYLYPLALPAWHGWTARMAGVGIVHQSNGQSLPRSRSWNRIQATLGADHPSGAWLTVRGWQRIPENAADDDNPDLTRWIGKAELTAGWNRRDGGSTYLTWRSTLRDMNRGSLRLDWLVPIGTAGEPGRNANRLRLHTQLFHGFGDSLLDYNVRRTVLSVGVSLVDW